MDENKETNEEIIDYHEAYAKKRAEMKEKYKEAIEAIAVANDMPLDDAFNMLEANIIHGAQYAYVKVEDFKTDYEELLEYSKHNAEEAGL